MVSKMKAKQIKSHYLQAAPKEQRQLKRIISQIKKCDHEWKWVATLTEACTKCWAYRHFGIMSDTYVDPCLGSTKRDLLALYNSDWPIAYVEQIEAVLN